VSDSSVFLRLNDTQKKGYYLQTIPKGIPFDFEMPKLQQTYFLVSVEYREGNAYNCIKANTTYAYLAQTELEAWEVSKMILEHYKKVHKTHWDTRTHSFVDGEFQGKPVRVQTGAWCGFYDELDAIEIIILGVKG
jgi:hypothetical protein